MTNNAPYEELVAKSVPIACDKSVPQAELVHKSLQKYIIEEKIRQLAIEKYRDSGYGITFEDMEKRFNVKKSKARRSLRYFHMKHVLFTARDLIQQGIDLLQNKNPQEYYATRIKAEILEDKKKKSVHVHPTGVVLSTSSNRATSKHPLSNPLQHQEAQSFLDVLLVLPFRPPHIHRLLLQLSINRECFKELMQNECSRNRGKKYEENIGRKHVTFTLSPNGTAEVAVRTNDAPFRIATDEDVSIIFSFLGQVKDRLLSLVSDPREREVPPIMDWVLKACDLNKDIEIDDKAQLTLPDIQLNYVDRIFRMYVKIMEGKAYYRVEESPTLNQILPEALDNIRYPYKSTDDKLNKLSEQVKYLVDIHASQEQDKLGLQRRFISTELKRVGV